MDSRGNQDLYRRSVRIGYTVGTFHLPEDVTFVADHGVGARLYDVQGRSYIDYLLGSGPILLGHAHPEVNAAVSAQLAKGMHFYTLNEPAIELGEKLNAIIPCAEEIKFLVSGSEAARHCLRMARVFTGRPKVMKFEGSFHGTGDYSLMSAFTPSKNYPRPEPESAGIPAAIQDLVLIAPWNDLAMTRAILTEHGKDVAAVLCEPVQRVMTPKPGFLEGLREITRELGILLIFDEMVTGFRMSLGGAQKIYGVTPDLAIFGKALTNGLPMTCIAGRSDVLSLARPKAKRGDASVYFGGTLNGNALSAAAALAVIHVLSHQGTYERLAASTQRLKDGLKSAAARHKLPLQIVGPDTFFQAFFSQSPITDLRSSLAAGSPLTERFQMECLKRGVLQQRGKFYVSTALTEGDIAETLQAFDAAMAATAA